MLYEELKNIKTDMLLYKIADYAHSAFCSLQEDGDIKTALSLLDDIRFFSKYHECVNLKNSEDYDDESFRLIEIWDIENGEKRGD